MEVFQTGRNSESVQKPVVEEYSNDLANVTTQFLNMAVNHVKEIRLTKDHVEKPRVQVTLVTFNTANQF